MTPAQFALAVGATPKWINNTRSILGLKLRLGPEAAHALSLIHQLHRALACSLARAAEFAAQVLRAPLHQRELRIALDDQGRMELVIDLWRDSTLHLARLSLAITRPPVEQRGRPSTRKQPRQRAVTRAIAYGVDVTRLREGRGRSVGERLVRLDENAAFLTVGRASLERKRSRA